MGFTRHIIGFIAALLFSVLGVVPMPMASTASHQAEFFPHQVAFTVEHTNVHFAARAPPTTVPDVAVTGDVTVMHGGAFVTHGVETLWASLNFGADFLAPNGGAGSRIGDWPRSNVEINEQLVIRQVDDSSCGQACGEMVLRDRGLDVQPTDIGSGLSSFQSNQAGNLAKQITNAAPNVRWMTGHADDLDHAYGVLNRPNGGSWVAEMSQGPGNVTHAVVVDGLTPSGGVRIRDPWDQTTYTMTRDDFIDNWTGGFVGQ